MRILFGSLAALGFFAASGVHVAALLGHPVQDAFPMVWLLHLGIFIVFIPAIFFLRRDGSPNDPLGFFRSLPPFAVTTLLVLFVYAFFNFFVALSATGATTPAIRDGRYVLQQKGRVVREISPAEYAAGRAAQARGFSGHWMIFYAVPAAIFLFRRRPTTA